MQLIATTKRLLVNGLIQQVKLTISEPDVLENYRIELRDRPGVYYVSYRGYKGKCRIISSYSRDIEEIRLIQTQSYVRVDII